MGTELAKSELTRLTKIANEQHLKGNKFTQRGVKLLVKGLYCYKKSGDALRKIKAGLTHGEWEPWVDKNFEGSKRTAENYMRLSREWKERIAAAVKDGSVLSLNDAMRLLRAPEDELRIPKGVKGEAATLLNALYAVKPGLCGHKELSEQSASFIFQDGMLSTWNDEVACEINCEVGNPRIEGAVHGNRLISVLSDIGDGKKLDIEVDSDKRELIVKTRKGNRKAFLNIAPIVERSEECEVPRPDSAAQWGKIKNPEQFWDAVKIVALCASADAAQPTYMCIHLCPKHIEAYDPSKEVACRYHVRTGLDSPVMVKHDSLRSLCSSPFTLSEVCVNGGWIHFRDKTSGLIVSARTWKATDEDFEAYPDLDNLFKQDAEPLTLHQNKALRDAMKRAEIFAKHDTNDPGRLTVRLKRNKLTIQGKDQHGRYFERFTVSYNGKSRKLHFDSTLLLEMIKRTKQFQVSATAIMADGDEFQFVTTFAESKPEKPTANP